MEDFLKKIGVSNEILEALKGEEADLTQLAEQYRSSIKDVFANDKDFIEPIKKSIQEQTFAGTAKKYKKELVRAYGLEMTDKEVDEVDFQAILDKIKETQKSKTASNINELKEELTALTNKLNEERNGYEEKIRSVESEWSNKFKNEKIEDTIKDYVRKADITVPFDFAYQGIISQLRSNYKLDLSDEGLQILVPDGSKVVNKDKTKTLGAFEVIDELIEPIKKKSNGTGSAPAATGTQPKVDGKLSDKTKELAKRLGVPV